MFHYICLIQVYHPTYLLYKIKAHYSSGREAIPTPLAVYPFSQSKEKIAS
jgi:hypothetical protein